MRNAGIAVALLLLSGATLRAQLPPTLDSGPLKMQPDQAISEEERTPKPDSDGLYSLVPGITLPVLVHAPSARNPEDAGECDPKVVMVAAIIREDGRATVSSSFTPRSNPCTNSAILAIKQSQFQPAKLNRRPVPVKACLSVSFERDQLSTPGIVRCPHEVNPVREEEADSEPTVTAPTIREVVPTFTGPVDTSSTTPTPNEYGVYSLGPGIVSPKLTTAAESAVGKCTHPVIVSAIVSTDGSITATGIYELYEREEKECNDLARVAIEKSHAQPATLNGSPVPIRVCFGVPYGRPVPPTVRAAPCQSHFAARPVGDPASFELRPGTKPPVVISAASVTESSWEARAKKIHGVVTVSVIVNDDGFPTDAHVVKGLGYGLDEIAVHTAKRYRFQPAMLDGKPVPARTTIEVEFRLDESKR